jgi:argininosuccinate synthase
VRFDVTIKGLDPALRIIAPVREWNLSRDEEIKYALKNNIPVKPKKSIYSIDQNLWGRSIESGPLEDPFNEPAEDAFEWCVPVRNAPEEPSYLEIGFEKGIPTTIDGKKAKPLDLINYVNSKAGLNGFGIVDHIEDRLVGIKSREVYECPAALTLIGAHKDLEKLVLTREELQFKSKVEEQWSWLVYSGLWIDPLRADLDAFIDSTQGRVTGTVRVKLHKGAMRVVGRKSENALYQRKLSTYDKSSTYDQMAAVGFIDIWGMASRVASQKASEKGGAKKVAPTVKTSRSKRKK